MKILLSVFVKSIYNSKNIASLILPLTLAILFPLSTFAQASDSLKSAQDSLFKANKTYIESFSGREDIFSGKGSCKIENGDRPKAEEEAKTRAIAQLARNLNTQVRSTVSLISSNESGVHGKRKSELKFNAETYSEQLLTEVHESSYKEYPAGIINVVVYIDKKRYREKVEDDIRKKKNQITNYVKKGLENYKKKNYVNAIHEFLSSLDLLKKYFYNIPVKDDIEKNGRNIEISSFVNDKIISFFREVNLENGVEDLLYDIKGNLNQKPIIYAVYYDEYGEKNPVGGLPLIVKFIEGEGKLRDNAVTKPKDGSAKLNVRYVNSKYKEAILNVSIDISEFEGLSKINGIKLSSVEVKIKKMKTVALAVSFINGGVYSAPLMLKNSIQSELLRRGLRVIDVLIKNKEAAPEDIEKVKKTNADYLLHVSIHAFNASTVGGYDNMFVSSGVGTLSVFEFPSGEIVASQKLKGAKGYGVSSSGAGWDAFSKIENQVLPGIEKLVSELK